MADVVSRLTGAFARAQAGASGAARMMEANASRIIGAFNGKGGGAALKSSILHHAAKGALIGAGAGVAGAGLHAVLELQ